MREQLKAIKTSFQEEQITATVAMLQLADLLNVDVNGQHRQSMIDYLNS